MEHKWYLWLLTCVLLLMSGLVGWMLVKDPVDTWMLGRATKADKPLVIQLIHLTGVPPALDRPSVALLAPGHIIIVLQPLVYNHFMTSCNLTNTSCLIVLLQLIIGMVL